MRVTLQLVFVCFLLLTSSQGITAKKNPPLAKSSPIYLYFESSALAYDANGCAIRMYINASIEIDSQGNITSFNVYNAGYYKDCPQIYFAERAMFATYSGSDITALYITESAENEDVDQVTRDSQAQAIALAELNVLVDDVIENN